MFLQLRKASNSWKRQNAPCKGTRLKAMLWVWLSTKRWRPVVVWLCLIRSLNLTTVLDARDRQASTPPPAETPTFLSSEAGWDARVSLVKRKVLPSLRIEPRSSSPPPPSYTKGAQHVRTRNVLVFLNRSRNPGATWHPQLGYSTDQVLLFQLAFGLTLGTIMPFCYQN
jgi:hypothetical protein